MSHDKTSVRGVHAVLYALFSKDGSVDLGAMRAQAELVRKANVAGVTVLGLATEVQKLATAEQHDIIATVAQDVVGKLPFSVTVTGGGIEEQRGKVRFAIDHGADWIILQPPAVGQFGGDTYLDFFLGVADGFDLRFAVQNAPQYLGRALSQQDVLRLRTANPNFDVIKAETAAIELAALVESAGDELDVLNGRGGLEMIDCLRAGAKGFVIAPDAVDYAQRIFTAFSNGDTAQAEQLYASVLPSIVFVMQSIEHLICYGKRLFGARAGVAIHDRAPALAPTKFGLAIINQRATDLAMFQ